MRSVLEQDYARIEYLVVDGQSTDDSVEIIRKYFLDDRQWRSSAIGLQSHTIDWWVSEKDAGQGDAINKGFAHARGDILGWLNSDDTYLPGAISAAVKVFQENPEVVIVYGDMLAVDEHGRTLNTLK